MIVGTFEYGDIHSSVYNLACKSVDTPILPALKARMVEIYGKHGVIDYGGNNYGTRKITRHIAYIGDSYTELRIRARDIAVWLTSTDWKQLRFDDEPDKYYLARIYDQIGLETFFELGEADITFECQPFAYMILATGDNPTWDEATFKWETNVPWGMADAYTFPATGQTSFIFEHLGTQEVNTESPQGSKFDITVVGTWSNDLNLTLNGKTLEFTEAVATSKTLVIKNVDMEVTLEGVNALNSLDGDLDSFLNVIPGQNTIEIDATSLNVTVILDFTPMWL